MYFTKIRQSNLTAYGYREIASLHTRDFYVPGKIRQLVKHLRQEHWIKLDFVDDSYPGNPGVQLVWDDIVPLLMTCQYNDECAVSVNTVSLRYRLDGCVYFETPWTLWDLVPFAEIRLWSNMYLHDVHGHKFLKPRD